MTRSCPYNLSFNTAKKTVIFVIYLGERVLVLSAGPGTIRASIPVELPRPRHPDVLVSSEFIASKRTVLEEMKVSKPVRRTE